MDDRLEAAFEALGIEEPTVFDDADAAVRRIEELYASSVAAIRDAFRGFCRGEPTLQPAAATYPFVGVRVTTPDLNLEGRLAYGVLHDPGLYGITVTRPELFGDYYRTQLGILMHTHRVPVVVASRTWRARSRPSGRTSCSTALPCRISPVPTIPSPTAPGRVPA
jgi:hypothetical protein